MCRKVLFLLVCSSLLLLVSDLDIAEAVPYFKSPFKSKACGFLRVFLEGVTRKSVKKCYRNPRNDCDG